MMASIIWNNEIFNKGIHGNLKESMGMKKITGKNNRLK